MSFLAINGSLNGLISANLAPVEACVDGVYTLVLNKDDWATEGKNNLGNVPQGNCVTLAITFNDIRTGG